MQMDNAKQDYMQAKIDEFDAEVDKLKARARQLSAQKRVAVDKRLQSLAAKREKLAEQAGEAKDVGADLFDGMKEELGDAWQRLKSLESDTSATH